MNQKPHRTNNPSRVGRLAELHDHIWQRQRPEDPVHGQSEHRPRESQGYESLRAIQEIAGVHEAAQLREFAHQPRHHKMMFDEQAVQQRQFDQSVIDQSLRTESGLPAFADHRPRGYYIFTAHMLFAPGMQILRESARLFERSTPVEYVGG